MKWIAIVMGQVILLVAFSSVAQDAPPSGQKLALEFDGSDPGPPHEGVCIDTEVAGRPDGSERRRRIRIELMGPEEPISGEEVEITFKARGAVIEERRTPPDGINPAAWKYATTLSHTSWIIVRVLCRKGEDGQLSIVGGDSENDGTAELLYEGQRIRVDLKTELSATQGVVAEALAHWGEYSANAKWMLTSKVDVHEGE